MSTLTRHSALAFSKNTHFHSLSKMPFCTAGSVRVTLLAFMLENALSLALAGEEFCEFLSGNTRCAGSNASCTDRFVSFMQQTQVPAPMSAPRRCARNK
jgi:hypothetical protein